MFDDCPAVPNLAGYHELRTAAAWKLLDTVQTVVLTGEDRKGWLQGQVSQDLRGLPVDGSCRACLLKATGQIEAVLGLWALADRFVVLTEAPEFLVERAKRFVILEDVKAELTASHVVSVQGPLASQVLADLMELPAGDAGTPELEGETVTVLRSGRTHSGGWDVVVPRLDGPAARRLAAGLPSASDAAFDLVLVEAGTPVFGVDIDSKTLPQELGPHFLAAHVSFDKGCYTGQEVVARIHSRGHTNRTWVGLSGSGELVPGSELRDRSGTVVGKVARSGNSPVFGWIGTAMVRNHAAEPGSLVWTQGTMAEVRPLPFER
jgi:folate-binding protein YgfZ